MSTSIQHVVPCIKFVLASLHLRGLQIAILYDFIYGENWQFRGVGGGHETKASASQAIK
jgi:hypothetical protein